MIDVERVLGEHVRQFRENCGVVEISLNKDSFDERFYEKSGLHLGRVAQPIGTELR